MKELETDGINHNHILTNPIVNGILKLETSGKLTHEEALTGMVNALAERNAELEKFILDLYSGMPTPPISKMP